MADVSHNPVYDLPTIDRGVMGDFLGESSTPAFVAPHPRASDAARPADATERTAVPGTNNSGNAQTSAGAVPTQVDLTAKTDSSTIRPGTVYLRASLLAGFHDYRSAQRLTNRDALLRMVEFAHPDLADLLAPPASSGLFELAHPRSAATGDPRTSISVQFRVKDYTVIDDLVTTHNARNRNHLFDACVTHFLTNTTVETTR